MVNRRVCLIVGAGVGLSASLARRFAKSDMAIALAARDADKLNGLVKELQATAYRCDASDLADVQTLFASVASDIGTPEVVIFNASRRVRGSINEIDPVQVKDAILTTCYGGFLVGQEASKIMLKEGKGTIMFTGASAGVKGFPKSATFAMGKFGLRGLAQSMARELHPKNIHIVHVVVDGGILSTDKSPSSINKTEEDTCLSPDAIANTYYNLHNQHRSAWAWEIEVRPWVEKF